MYGPYMEYIQGKTNLATNTLSLLSNNGNQKTIQESNYLTQTMSEINYVQEICEGTLPIHYKMTHPYQQKDPCLMKN